jgi:hypothetical protein
MSMTLRKTDNEAESEVAKFLDRNFYPAHVKNFIRYKDISNQMAGIDVQFDHNNISNMLVDEKAAVHYVNKDLPTFAFEINFLLSNGQLVDGWFYDKNKFTQYYLLAWLWAKKDAGFIAEEITQIDLIIINRKRIVDMLSENGLTHQKAIELSGEIRQKNEPGAYYKNSSNPFYFFYSPQLAEKPINIIITKKELIKLSVARHLIKPE